MNIVEKLNEWWSNLQSNSKKTEVEAIAKLSVKKDKFPCKECIITTVCTEICDRVETDDEKITEIVRENICPDCGGEGFYGGPTGGASMNISCATCGHRFNISPVGVERI